MNQSQHYLEHLLASIEKKRLLSIQEYHKTDLYEDTDIDGVSAWYSEIVSAVRQNPPTFYVRCLQIIENEKGMIKMVEYDYFDCGECSLGDTTFVIITEA